MTAKNPVLVPTNESVDDFLAALDETRRTDAEALLQIYRGITQEEPVLWGGGIIGFGQVHYAYATGREGDMPAAGFSPRKQSLTLYINGFDEYGDLLDALGRHTTSVSCLYIKRLSDVDGTTLRELIRRSYEANTQSTDAHEKPHTIDAYIDLQPATQQGLLRQLRLILSDALPGAEEAIRYELPTLRVHDKNIVHFGGYSDHIGLYPIPKSLRKKYATYLRGAATAWLPLDQPLPADMVREVAQCLLDERLK